MLAILFMNVFAPLIDYFVVQAPTSRRRRQAPCRRRDSTPLHVPVRRRRSAWSARCWSRSRRSACTTGRRPTRSRPAEERALRRRAGQAGEELAAPKDPVALRRAHPAPAGRPRDRRAACRPTSRTRRPTTSARRAATRRRAGRARRTTPASSGCRTTRTVYFVMKDDAGRAWSCCRSRATACGATLYGFLALEPDGNTVAGITFYEQKETPGLGGEVEQPEVEGAVGGRKVYDAVGAEARA